MVSSKEENSEHRKHMLIAWGLTFGAGLVLGFFITLVAAFWGVGIHANSASPTWVKAILQPAILFFQLSEEYMSSEMKKAIGATGLFVAFGVNMAAWAIIFSAVTAPVLYIIRILYRKV